MWSLSTISKLNTTTQPVDNETLLVYEFIDFAEKAKENISEAKANLQAGYHVLMDLKHKFGVYDDPKLLMQLKKIYTELAVFGGLLRHKETKIKDAEITVWDMHKNTQEKKRKLEKAAQRGKRRENRKNKKKQ